MPKTGVQGAPALRTKSHEILEHVPKLPRAHLRWTWGRTSSGCATCARLAAQSCNAVTRCREPDDRGRIERNFFRPPAIPPGHLHLEAVFRGGGLCSLPRTRSAKYLPLTRHQMEPSCSVFSLGGFGAWRRLHAVALGRRHVRRGGWWRRWNARRWRGRQPEGHRRGRRS